MWHLIPRKILSLVIHNSQHSKASILCKAAWEEQTAFEVAVSEREITVEKETPYVIEVVGDKVGKIFLLKLALPDKKRYLGLASKVSTLGAKMGSLFIQFFRRQLRGDDEAGNILLDFIHIEKVLFLMQ